MVWGRMVAKVCSTSHGQPPSGSRNRARTMLADEFDFGFAVQWMRKDLGIALAEARINRANLPATALVDQLYAQVTAMGGAR
ncbi:MAG TPA: NAD(P)-dependent oxidoreductase [Rhodospirillales bacterium]|nr:NAD(P)-dependent oxidoreductase [Rhodospirillales bacterium]